MRYLEFPPQSGVDLGAGRKISAIGLGTWQFGSREWGYGVAYDDG
jgi:diketogulonate reductase-like aldo/keto reductase